MSAIRQKLRSFWDINVSMTTPFMSALFHPRPIDGDSPDFEWRSRPRSELLMSCDSLGMSERTGMSANQSHSQREREHEQTAGGRANSWRRSRRRSANASVTHKSPSAPFFVMKQFRFDSKFVSRQSKRFRGVPTAAEQISSSSWILVWL